MKCLVVAACLSVPIAEPHGGERVAQAPVTVAFAAYSSDASVVSVGGNGKLRVDAVWLAVQDASVWPASACTQPNARALIGTTTRNLMDAASTETTLDIGRWCTLAVQLRRTSKSIAGAPAELRGAAIVMRGVRGDGTRVVLRSRRLATAALRARELDGFAVTAEGAHWIVGVDLARWLEGVDLAMAETSEDGRELRIDDASNADLLAAFEANVPAGFAVFADRDGDHRVDADERRQPIATR